VLVAANAFVIPAVCGLFLLACLSVNPKPIEQNIFAVSLFAVFTLGSPLWLPALGFVLHFRACMRA